MSNETKRLALEEYKEDVDVKFNNARVEIGFCRDYHYGIIIIKYSNRVIENNTKEQLINLIIHEVAHIKYPNHKKVFKDECKRIAKKLGIIFDDDCYGKIPLNQYNYIYECLHCGNKIGKVRPFKEKKLHGPCYKKLKEEGEICPASKSEYISI